MIIIDSFLLSKSLALLLLHMDHQMATGIEFKTLTAAFPIRILCQHCRKSRIGIDITRTTAKFWRKGSKLCSEVAVVHRWLVSLIWFSQGTHLTLKIVLNPKFQKSIYHKTRQKKMDLTWHPVISSSIFIHPDFRVYYTVIHILEIVKFSH